MGRTASPATPGTDPQTTPATDLGATPTALGTGDIDEEVLQQAVRAETAEERADRLERDMAEMREQMRALARNQVSKPMPVVEKLPTLADVMKRKPQESTLTEDGWYVPPVHQTDRLTNVKG